MKELKIGEVMTVKKKWNELFDSEEDLIEAMLKCNATYHEGRNNIVNYGIVAGYGYIYSFQQYYAKHGTLTEKQMTQLKRLAKAVWIYLKNNETKRR